MRNIKLTVEYDGTDHAGWQVQKNAHSIQHFIEKALNKITQQEVGVISSGRTDSGVHAKAQVANFKSCTKLSCESLLKALNSNLPPDIAVKKVEDVPLSFHSRFSAKSKLYRYTILNSRIHSPLVGRFVYQVPYKLDVDAMKKAARHMRGRQDFKSFQAKDKIERPSVCEVKSLSISKKGDLIYIDIEASGFLYKMVRNIVGTLIEVGRGRIDHKDIKKIISACDRKVSGPTVPPQGLCLLEVRYD